MNPEDYFKAGSEGYVQTKQAIDQINAGRAAGLPDMDQYENDLKASIALAKQSGWKQWKGFDTTRQAINGLVPQINAFAAKQNEAASQGSQIEASRNLLKTYGIDLPPEQVAAIDLAMRNNNISELKAFNSATSARLTAAIAEQIPATEAEQAKIDADKERASAAKQKAEMEKSEFENAKYSLEEALKDRYRTIMDVKSDPDIKSSFGIPIVRLFPGTDRSSLSAKVDQLANQEWIDAIIKAKAAGATFGSLTEKEGARLANAATLLSDPSKLNYETGNDELLKMAESVKRLYRKATGREIQDDLKLASPTPPDEQDPAQARETEAAAFRAVLESAP